MPRPRAGTFEVARPGQRHRARLRVADGTKSERFDLPAAMNEPKARAYLARLHIEEDATQTVYKAK